VTLVRHGPALHLARVRSLVPVEVPRARGWLAWGGWRRAGEAPRARPGDGDRGEVAVPSTGASIVRKRAGAQSGGALNRAIRMQSTYSLGMAIAACQGSIVQCAGAPGRSS